MPFTHDGSADPSPLVAEAAKRWRADLFDAGGRNTLLYFRDLKVGTLDLGEADARALDTLFMGRTVTLGRLFPDGLDAARKRALAIRKRTVEFEEERGVWTCYLAEGMAVWEEERRRPQAPVLLRAATVEPAQERGEFTLTLREETEVNPALLHVLRTSFAASVETGDFTDLLETDGRISLASVSERLAKRAPGVPGLRFEPRVVVGTFSYAKLPMVTDLDNAGELLASHDVVAALSGAPTAQRAVAAEHPETPVDAHAPKDEFLVLDADSSQSAVVNAVVRSQHLVVQGPPGTGKSQTIANLIASLMARGRRVLFVAEKRAAIDAVLSRMHHVGLADLVMDIHGGTSDRRRIAQDLGATLERAARTRQPDVAGVHHALEQRREALSRHTRTMHEPRVPWRVSVFQAQAALLGLAGHASELRFPLPVLEGLTARTAEAAREALREYVDRGGVRADAVSEWARADLPRGSDAQRALDTVRDLRTRLLPRLRETARAAADACGLRGPGTPQECETTRALLRRVQDTADDLGPQVFEEDLDRFLHAFSRDLRRSEPLDPPLNWSERRRLRRRARGWTTVRKSAGAWVEALHRAREARREWHAERTDGGEPRPIGTLPDLEEALGQCTRALAALARVLPDDVSTHEAPFTDLEALLTRLSRDAPGAHGRPRMMELHSMLVRHGLEPLIRELRSPEIGGADGPAAVRRFDHVWYSSILERVGAADPGYGAFDGTSLNTTVAEFAETDSEHLRRNAQRVLRRTAETLFEVLDAYPQQRTLIKKQASLRRRHMPVRDLLGKAEQTLFALKPCWAMSPLVVSQLLPARRLFDVVVFDEASQIPVADAVPAIARADTVVVAGDSRQLPPTAFFAGAREEAEEDDDLSFTSGFDSVLEALHPLLPSRALSWHYRSRNERLIAFSNANVYDRSLTTFPGAEEEGAVRHILVGDVGDPGQEKSVTAEVRKVVEEVIAHAESRPGESLGVITMGIEHAERIEAALDRALAQRRDLAGFFAEDRRERFFVKNLERVQGDERDAVILSLGYGKGTDGRMRHHFGPLNLKGGERRLNVAVTRAKRRMTLVSSFGSRDLDPGRLNAEGAKLLRRYLEFAESGGSDLGAALEEKPELNPFEVDVRDRLTAEGIPLTCQYGVVGYRIDFVAAHPDQPGRMVLAIEADGASYHSSASARDRDRLRQQQLENLGWTFHRIWSTDWFRDPVGEVAKARLAYDRAVGAADEHGGGDGTGPAGAGRQDGDRGTRPVGGSTGGSAHAPSAASPSQRQGPAPSLPPGLPITEYRPRDLVALAAWIESDGLLRTEDEVLREAMCFLRFRRKGKRIEDALTRAIRSARARRGR
ncbi:AAA domain-containing protein [Nocardiopsis sp. LOL_012]|uniref:AAA domain-containing protein n=1 Tax=Nocardiopsis sp. LOL_012 TaxID=3345409 RepID=UPI003A8C5308